ncbi:helix-turn-helix transcriptional regulator [Micromonospora matsumotoense]|uniref:helix-turn-helix transcriptional regulator n=1 Tax=Micromonospora matsumotoense TaxID=121616 RepID=UPI0033EAC645
MALRRHRLAQRRKAVGHTQESLAEKLGVDRTTVVRWERAESEPQPWIRPRFADALGVSPDELSGLLADVGAARTQRGDRMSAVLKNPRTTDLAAVANLRQELARLIDSYDAGPSVAILPEASRLHSEVNLLRAHAAGEAVRRALRGVEAATSIFMGQLVWDASQRRNAQAALSYYDQAAHAAMQANDAETEAQARLRRSFVALYSEGDPQSGLTQAAQAAQVAAQGRDHALSAVALLHVGEANAMMGERSACERALGQAESQLGLIDGDERPDKLASAGQLNRLAGSCYLRLGEPRRAQSLLEGVPAGIQERRKSHAIVLGNLALARLRQRDLDGATETLHQVIDAVEETRGGGAVNVLFAAGRELRPWRDRPDVQEIMDRTLALMSS